MHFETHFIEKISDKVPAGEGLLRGSFSGLRPPKVATATEGGERGIRTPGTCYSTPVFETGTLNRSDISPYM
jgi:hypothetical protein